MPRRSRWVHLMLLVATLGTTTVAGSFHYASFVSDFGAISVTWPTTGLLAHGLLYSLTILGILGAHELGHYLACRYYGVDATLPYFLPAPLLTGTLGAVIRIRSAFPTKKILFDIAVAGPIAGFLVLVPALFVGLAFSNIVRLPGDFSGYSLGEPPLFRLAMWLVLGSIPDGYSMNMHPMVFAAWFGLFATAANLLPFGQLDGGHVSYAVLGKDATRISLATVGMAIALTFYSLSWLLVTALMVLMLLTTGARHPPVIYDGEPLDSTRRIIAVLMIVIFVLCFTPTLMEPYALLPQ